MMVLSFNSMLLKQKSIFLDNFLKWKVEVRITVQSLMSWRYYIFYILSCVLDKLFCVRIIWRWYLFRCVLIQVFCKWQHVIRKVNSCVVVEVIGLFHDFVEVKLHGNMYLKRRLNLWSRLGFLFLFFLLFVIFL